MLTTESTKGTEEKKGSIQKGHNRKEDRAARTLRRLMNADKVDEEQSQMKPPTAIGWF
jgi:hypothetical protein